MLLEKSGILFFLARFTAPLMDFLGLPGETALVCFTSIFLNVYSAIAVIETLNLSGREIIILTTSCLIAHNFFIENAVLKKAGSPLFRITFHRLFFAIATAWILNLILPAEGASRIVDAMPLAPAAASAPLALMPEIGLDVTELPSLLLSWFISSSMLILRVSLIILAVVFLQKLMDEFGLMKFFGRLSSPLMRVLGLSANAGYVWVVANVIGLLYGSAALVEEARNGTLSPREVKLFNNHVAISHSQMEDTFLFMALGAPALWVALPRFIVAIIVVWLERGCRFLFRKLF